MTRHHLSLWRELFAGMALDDVSRTSIERAKEALLTSGKSTATVNRYLHTLRHLFNTARSWDLTDRNPVSSRGLFLREPPPRERIFTAEEERRILAVCNNPLYQLVVLALMTGARRDELVKATWERNINLADRMMTLYADETKSKISRWVPLNMTAIEILMSLPGRGQGGQVFPFTGNYYGKHFHDALEAAAIKGANFHTIRHTVTSRLHAAGVPVGTVDLLTGHTSRGTTLRCYTHPQMEELRNAVEKLEIRAAMQGSVSV